MCKSQGFRDQESSVQSHLSVHSEFKAWPCYATVKQWKQIRGNMGCYINYYFSYKYIVSNYLLINFILSFKTWKSVWTRATNIYVQDSTCPVTSPCAFEKCWFKKKEQGTVLYKAFSDNRQNIKSLPWKTHSSLLHWWEVGPFVFW